MVAWQIEQLTSADGLDAILAIEQASFSNPWTREMYLSELGNRGVAYLYLARAPSGPAVGFCSVWRIFDELHINNLAVEPSHRRQGVATALLTFVLSEGSRLGTKKSTLEVRRSNGEARSLYERFGFTVSGVRRDYYSHPVEDALILWRDVSVHGRS